MAAEKENCVCIVDCVSNSDGSTVTRLLSELTGEREVDNGRPVKWNISNRYYETEVWLEVRGHPGEPEGAWQALITICDLSLMSSVKRAYSVWEGLGPEATPPVSLLMGVVDGCGLGESVKSEVVQWCLERSVELVEWDINQNSTNKEEEDDFPESVGVARISEALQAHMWPVMRLKPRGLGKDRETSADAAAAAQCNGEKSAVEENGCIERGDVCDDLREPANSSESQETEKTSSQCDLASGDSREARLGALLGASAMETLERDEEGEIDSFETLFAKFSEMKAHAQSLSHEERKAYAEKVVMSFWKAIGGDEAEIGSDSEQN